MDVENQLFWDLLWFAVFGLLPLAWGLLMRRSSKRSGSRRRTPGGPAALALATFIAGPLAALPAPDADTVMIVFRPDATVAGAMEGLEASRGRLIWSDASDTVWAVDISGGGDARQFYAHGALLISNSILPAGCFNWTRI